LGGYQKITYDDLISLQDNSCPYIKAGYTFNIRLKGAGRADNKRDGLKT
jgi:hypothetical protein